MVSKLRIIWKQTVAAISRGEDDLMWDSDVAVFRDARKGVRNLLDYSAISKTTVAKDKQDNGNHIVDSSSTDDESGVVLIGVSTGSSSGVVPEEEMMMDATFDSTPSQWSSTQGGFIAEEVSATTTLVFPHMKELMAIEGQ